MWTLPKLRANDRVVVRSKEEILATLDENGALEGMPFMPEMFQFCGKELTVGAVAHKTCDTAMRTGGRKLDRTVHLTGARCSGRAHGGCDADCLIFWKEQWLRPAADERAAAGPGRAARPNTRHGKCTEELVAQGTRNPGLETGEPRYRCQATELFAASRPLPWWNLRQFALDLTTGNTRFSELARVLALNAVYTLRRLPVGYRFWSALYAWVHRRLTGRSDPFITGTIATGTPTPSATLDLTAGETVRIRPAAEIISTLNDKNSNRGMWFGPEEVAYCGGTFKVRGRVERIINERTGEMLDMKTPCVTLEGVTCRAHYSDARFLCPRQIYSYWREIWLERAGAARNPQ